MHPRRRHIRPVNVVTTATVQQRANNQKFKYVRVGDTHARNAYKQKMMKHEARKPPDTRAVMTVPLQTKDNKAHNARISFTSVPYYSQRNDPTLSGKQYSRQPLKAELQHGLQYTETVTEQMDDRLDEESLASREQQIYEFSLVDEDQPRPRSMTPVSRGPQTPTDSGFITSDAISFTSPCGRSTPNSEVGQVPIPHGEVDESEVKENQTFVQRVVYAVPECIRRLKLHYQARKMQQMDNDDDTSEEPKVVKNNDRYYGSYSNWTMRKPSPVPYLRETDCGSIGAKSTIRRTMADTVTKLAGLVAKRAQDIHDEDGKVVSPGDCVWISKTYLTTAIYVGKQTVIRCVGNEIVKEMIDPFSTLWKATFTKGYVTIQSKQDIVIAAKMQLGDSFIGTNDEFIVNCLTNLDSLEAYELGFRLHDATGHETNFSMPELF
ncbi:uncharacterized protein [Haliotis cracherodii]|uniref:uncharacterized protein n=1 Tax=Haliotis cracherodii TaxID=6455 RepID=UPI0039EBBD73